MSPSIRPRRLTAASFAKLARFLGHLRESGSVSLAARRAGTGRNSVYLRRKVDPASARDGTERVLRWRDRRVGAVCEYGNRLLMFLLRIFRPEVYGRPGR